MMTWQKVSFFCSPSVSFAVILDGSCIPGLQIVLDDADMAKKCVLCCVRFLDVSLLTLDQANERCTHEFERHSPDSLRKGQQNSIPLFLPPCATNAPRHGIRVPPGLSRSPTPLVNASPFLAPRFPFVPDLTCTPSFFTHFNHQGRFICHSEQRGLREPAPNNSRLQPSPTVNSLVQRALPQIARETVHTLLDVKYDNFQAVSISTKLFPLHVLPDLPECSGSAMMRIVSILLQNISLLPSGCLLNDIQTTAMLPRMTRS
jgi:hypothetical protein